MSHTHLKEQSQPVELEQALGAMNLNQPTSDEVDQFKKNRREASKSLDISAKAFVPKK